MENDALQINAAGTYSYATTTSAPFKLPTGADGLVPQRVRIATNGNAFVTVGATSGSLTASSASVLVTISDALVLWVGRQPWIAARSESGTVLVNVQPVEG